MPAEPDRKNAPVFVLVNLIVKDASVYRQYEKGFFPKLKEFGGSFVTYDDAPEHLEGTSPRAGRIIIFTFPTEDHFRRWWADPEYQALSDHRRNGCEQVFITLVHGLPPRPTA